MRDDGAAAADFHRAVRGAAQLDRAAACAVRRLDQRPVGARLPARAGPAAAAADALPRPAGAGAADGADQFPAAIYDADDAGSESAADDDADAADFYDHADKLSGGARFVLFFVEPAGSDPAIFSQPRIQTIHAGDMSNSIETSGESVEEAVLEALVQLGARKDEVDVEVLATARAGVLGLGAREARVRVTRKSVPAEEEAPEVEGNVAPPSGNLAPQGNVDRRAPERRGQVSQPHSQQPHQGRGRRRENPRRGRGGGGNGNANPNPPRQNQAAPAGDDDSSAPGRKSVGVEEQRLEAIEILKQILEQMGEQTEVRQIEVDAETVELEIKGDGSGILIGRHGQTLDALEYIVNRILARRIKDAAPISLETESYRARRRQQLHRMALSMGEKAKREHKPVRLEPMAPRDRRVVHLALKEDPMITTRSAGEGLMRSIEIMPTDSSGRPENRGGGQNRGRRRDGERGNPPQPQRENPERGNSEQEREVQRIEPDRGNEALGEQGGFKHGQKRIV